MIKHRQLLNLKDPRACAAKNKAREPAAGLALSWAARAAARPLLPAPAPHRAQAKAAQQYAR